MKKLLLFLTVTCVIALLVWWLRAPEPQRRDSVDEIRIVFLDVGQGDAVLISVAGDHILYDGGPSDGLARRLSDLGVQGLKLAIASHPHSDHIGGLDEILSEFSVDAFMDNGEPYTTDAYDRLMRLVEADPSITYLSAGSRTITIGGLALRFLPLPEASTNINNRSVAVIVDWGNFEMWLSGDSEVEQLNYYAEAGLLEDVEVLKAPHHGSDNGFTTPFLEGLLAEVVLIGTGRDNRYGHPMPAALQAYPRGGLSGVYRTDLHGDITILARSDGSFTVETTRNSTATGGSE